jgi:hypothetical protein
MGLLGILFTWMKVYHIFLNKVLYNRTLFKKVKFVNIFYTLKILYPIWIFIGLFTFNCIYWILLLLGIVKYFIYSLIKGKMYNFYEIAETIICIIFYFLLIV